jgi:hypothetical protein
LLKYTKVCILVKALQEHFRGLYIWVKKGNCKNV